MIYVLLLILFLATIVSMATIVLTGMIQKPGSISILRKRVETALHFVTSVLDWVKQNCAES